MVTKQWLKFKIFVSRLLGLSSWEKSLNMNLVDHLVKSLSNRVQKFESDNPGRPISVMALRMKGADL